MSPFLVPMMMGNRGAADVSMRYGFRGPCETTVTACAAGTHSVANGARLVATGRCDVVDRRLRRGGDDRDGHGRLHQHDGPVDDAASRCPSTSKRDGFVIGEGGAVLVLEELEPGRGPGRPHLRRDRRGGEHRRRPPHHRPGPARRRGGDVHGAGPASTPA